MNGQTTERIDGWMDGWRMDDDATDASQLQPAGTPDLAQ